MRLLIIMLASTAVVAAADPVKRAVELNSDTVGVIGLPLAESTDPVFRIQMTATVDEHGEGDGLLILDPNAPSAYDEFGFPGATTEIPAIKLDCKFKRMKRTVKTYVSRRLGAPDDETQEFKEDWRLYSVTGPKITSRLFLATVESRQWQDGRFLVKGKDDKVKYVINLHEPQQLALPPCHPGCFPAGTRIAIPDGTKAIEDIVEGDVVTTVTAAKVFGRAKVKSVFITRNRLVEVQTDDGMLLTTTTQPLSLVNGELKAAGQLESGDKIHKSRTGKLREIAVKTVAPTGRETKVFNLVLDEPVLFIANDFLARSKPPAPDGELVQP